MFLAAVGWAPLLGELLRFFMTGEGIGGGLSSFHVGLELDDVLVVVLELPGSWVNTVESVYLPPAASWNQKPNNHSILMLFFFFIG